MIQIDTSILIGGLTGPKHHWRALEAALEAGEQIAISSLALYEWLRGPRTPGELAIQEDFAPVERLHSF